MTAEGGQWRIRLATAAESDFRNILVWTAEQFGESQARVYAETLSLAIDSLTEGPDIVGSRRRDDIGSGLMSLHAARKGRIASHIVIYRVSTIDDTAIIEILRLLHDSMDIVRHL